MKSIAEGNALELVKREQPSRERNEPKKEKARKHSCISLTLNAKILFELKAQILSRLTIALRARSPDSHT